MYTIRAYYLQYCGSYAPHRQRRTMDDGRRTPDDGRWTLDAGPSTPYYKLTGELKKSILTHLPIILKKRVTLFKKSNVAGLDQESATGKFTSYDATLTLVISYLILGRVYSNRASLKKNFVGGFRATKIWIRKVGIYFFFFWNQGR